jgi:CBS domain-containing protein
MFFDFRPIYGDYSLAQEIREMMVEKAKNSLTMQQLLRKDAIRFKVPVSALGRINLKPKSKVLNLKKSGMMQIINMIRIHSIKYGIKDVNTVKRLQSLQQLQAFHPRDVQNAKTALHHFMTFRLNQNLLELEEKKPLSNDISLLELSKEDKRKLKEALQIANRMQQVLEISFNRNRVV